MINLARKEKKANPIKKSLSLSIGLAWTGGITPNLDSTVVACLLRVLNNSKVKSFMKNFAAECVLQPPLKLLIMYVLKCPPLGRYWNILTSDKDAQSYVSYDPSIACTIVLLLFIR